MLFRSHPLPSLLLPLAPPPASSPGHGDHERQREEEGWRLGAAVREARRPPLRACHRRHHQRRGLRPRIAIAVTTNAGGYGHASPSPGRASAAETAVHVAVAVVLAPTDRLSGADSSLDHNAGKWNGIF